MINRQAQVDSQPVRELERRAGHKPLVSAVPRLVTEEEVMTRGSRARQVESVPRWEVDQAWVHWVAGHWLLITSTKVHRRQGQVAAQLKPRRVPGPVQAGRRVPAPGKEPWQQVPRVWPAAPRLVLQGNPSRAGSGRKRDKDFRE